jgi:hypothetical protein
MVRHALSAVLLVVAVLGSWQRLDARLPSAAPPLPPPSGRTVRVATVPELQAAVRNLRSDTTILIARGTYRLTSTLHIGNRELSNVALRGETGRFDDVVLAGPGMSNKDHGNAPHGVWTGNGVNGVLLAHLTIRDFFFHPIILNAGTRAPRLYNVRLVDGGEQLLKSNPDERGEGIHDGVVEYSVFEFTSRSRSSYTNGVDVLGGRGWIVRDNLFRNIHAPDGQLAGPSILFWRGARDTIVERNTFINCQREIALGLVRATPTDHAGGVIRNNFIYRDPWVQGDAGINVIDSPGTLVLHNTVITSGTYPNAIEYRFPATTGVSVVNNLTDAAIRSREGATADVRSNVTSATLGLFVAPTSGDLRLRADAAVAIDRGIAIEGADTDWEGERRPRGSGVDIGADESGP